MTDAKPSLVVTRDFDVGAMVVESGVLDERNLDDLYRTGDRIFSDAVARPSPIATRPLARSEPFGF